MKTLTTIIFSLTILATSYCSAQSKDTKGSTKKATVCYDSATASEINLYLIKGAEARELLLECQKNRIQDSIDRAECNRLLVVEEEYSSNLNRDMILLEDKVKSLRIRLIGTYITIGLTGVLLFVLR